MVRGSHFTFFAHTLHMHAVLSGATAAVVVTFTVVFSLLMILFCMKLRASAGNEKVGDYTSVACLFTIILQFNLQRCHV